MWIFTTAGNLVDLIYVRKRSWYIFYDCTFITLVVKFYTDGGNCLSLNIRSFKKNCGKFARSIPFCLVSWSDWSSFITVWPIPSLTHWGRVTHRCISKLTIIGSDNGLAPNRRQAIIWTNDVILLIGPLGTNFSGILFKYHTFSSKKMPLKMLSGKWRLFCLSPNVLLPHEFLLQCVDVHSGMTYVNTNRFMKMISKVHKSGNF